jgi:hypothetical protein
MSNFHFDLSLKLPQGEVHDFSGEVQKLSREVQKFSGEVRTSSHLPSKSGHATNEQQDKRKGINKNSHSCIKHSTRRKTTSLLVLYIFIGPILALLNFTVVVLRTLDHILNLRLILFPDGLIHFLILEYASPALMFSGRLYFILYKP